MDPECPSDPTTDAPTWIPECRSDPTCEARPERLL